MKKTTSLILTAILAVGVIPSVHAQEDYEKLIPEIKNRISIPEEYSEFSYNGSYEDNGDLRYSFSWTKETDGRKETIDVEAREDGSIMSYNKRDNSQRFDFLKMDIAEAESQAEDFIKRTNPDLDCKLRFEAAEYSYGGQSFDIYAVFDGVEYYRSVGSIEVSKDDDIVNMHLNIPEIAESGNTEFISQSDGYDLYMEKIGVKTSYKTYTDNEHKKVITFPTYSLDNLKAIDALTGEVIEIGGDEKIYGNSAATKEELAMDSAGGGYRELTESEKEKLAEIEKLISKSKAAENIKNRLGVILSMEKINFNNSRIGEYSYSFYEDKYSASVNAHNGDIIWFSDYSDENKAILNYKNKEDAQKLLNKLAPSDGKKYKLDTYLSEYDDGNIRTGFIYEKNGIKVEGPSANITERYFSLTPLSPYEKAEYASKDTFKPIDEVFGDIQTVKLRYIDTKDGVKAGYITDTITVNAITGKSVNYRNEEIKDKKYIYSDLDGHWVKEIAQKMARAGLGFEGGVFNPQLSVSEKEALLFLDEISYEYKENEDDISEEPLSRIRFAQLMAERMGYADIMNFDIYINPFKDVTENYGSVAILKALGIIDGDEETFRPNDNLTRAELVTMLYRALLSK